MGLHNRESKRRKTSQTTEKTPKYDQQEAAPTTAILDSLKKVGSSRKKDVQLKVKGFSLGVKFGLVISLVAALLCSFASISVYFQSEKALLAEINRKGAATVKSVAGIARAYHEEYSKVMQEMPPENTKTKNEERTKFLDRLYQIELKYKRFLESIVSITVDRDNKPEKFFSEEILNVSILAEPIPDIQAGKVKYDKIQSVSEDVEELIGGQVYKAGIQVGDGTLATQEQIFRIKAYFLPLLPDGKLEAWVFISKRDIERTTQSVWTGIFVITLLAVGIGIGISFLLSRHVTQPVRTLIGDVEKVSRGDLDHVTSVTSKDEIGILANTFNLMTKNLKVAHQNELERKAREHELQVATEIQSNLLPSQVPKISGYEIAAFYNPSKEVGGDYYDFLTIDSDHIGFIVADVSGKSIPGCMVMTMARALVRIHASNIFSPSKMFMQVNQTLCQDIRKGMFVTAMYGILKISTGEFDVSSAGHNPIILWRASSKKHELVNPKGMALGLSKPSLFDKTMKEEKARIEPGDVVMLYTDGVSEAMSPKNEEFGDDRLCQIVAQEANSTPEHMVEVLVENLKKWRQNCPQSDDITILTFKRNASSK